MNDERRNDTITLTRDEIIELTGRKRPLDQLRVLHARGFSRAYFAGGVVKLERAHYQAVCAGQFATAPGFGNTKRPTLRPLPFMKGKP